MNRSISEQVLTQQTLGELIAQSLDGDREAFGRIVRQYQGLVSGVTFGMTGDYHKSEDLAQETFLVAWKRLAELRDFQKLPQWFCGIARMLVRNDQSKNATRPVTISYHATNAEVVEDKPTCTPEPLDHVIREERNHLVAEAIAKIPERYRVPLVMSIRSKMNTAEIAEALEITEDTLYQRISRAKKFLRTELEKQVEHSIRATGPGEFFSLGVVAALPVVAKLTASKVLATATSAAVVSESALLTPLATAGTGTSCSTGSCSTAGTLSLGAMAKLALATSFHFAGWLFLILGVLPGIWFSIRNAPSLAARRFLVLTSLRAHYLFVLVCSCLYAKFWLFPDLYWTFGPYSQILSNTLAGQMSIGFPAVLGLLGVYAILVLGIAPLRYRLILCSESGLQTPSHDEQRPFRVFARIHLKGAFLTWGIAAVTVYAITTYLVISRLYTVQTEWAMAWNDCCGFTPWQSFLHYHGTLYVVVGLLFLVILAVAHLRFYALCKGEDTVAATPPIINPNMPFRIRWLIEWVVFLGVFLLAAMVIAMYVVPWGIVTVPRSPFLFTAWLAFVAILTAGVAAFNVRVPVLRLPVTLLAVIGLLASSLYYSLKSLTLVWTKSTSYPFQAFFDSTASWPVVLIAMLLGYCIFFAILLTLALGALYLRRLAAGKPDFYRRKTLAIVYGTALGMVLLAVTLAHSYLMNSYFSLLILVRKDASLSVEHSERMIGLANAVVNHSGYRHGGRAWALNIRGGILLGAGRYDEAIADYDESLGNDIWATNRAGYVYRFYIAHSRGVARMFQGDDAAALADFDLAERFEEEYGSPMYYPELFYHRAVVKERSGDVQGAVADYSKAIALLERYGDPPPVYSAIQRPESGRERVINEHGNGEIGYELPLDGLKTIRDNLQSAQ